VIEGISLLADFTVPVWILIAVLLMAGGAIAASADESYRKNKGRRE
jgi:hypothetical protein